MSFKPAFSAFALCLCAGMVLPAAAAPRFIPVYSDHFFEYSLFKMGKSKNRVRWKISNKSGADIELSTITVKYSCSETPRKHYFSTRLKSGQAKAFVGADRVCDSAVTEFEILEVDFTPVELSDGQNRLTCPRGNRFFIPERVRPNLYKLYFRDGTRIQWVGAKKVRGDKTYYGFDIDKLVGMACMEVPPPDRIKQMGYRLKRFLNEYSVDSCVADGKARAECRKTQYLLRRNKAGGVRG